MSRHNAGNELAPTSGINDSLQPGTQSEKGLVGGTFRLDAMSPGSATEASGMSGRRKSAGMQAVFFAVLVVAAGGVVYAMRQMGIGPLKGFASMKAPDYDVTKGVSVANSDHQRVLKELSAATQTAQVPPEQVQKNPFRLADALGTSPAPDEGATKSEAQRRAAEEKARKDAETRHKQIEAKLATLKINSIMTGSKPMARLGDTLVHVGDMLDETFKVKAINSRSVELEANGVTYLLSLDEDPTKKGSTRSSRKR